MSLTPVPLNPIDCGLLIAERLLRRYGFQSNRVHVHVDFHGRLDVARLRAVADGLAARWPLITSRLVRSPRPAWVPTGDQRWPIREETLESDAEADLVRATQRLSLEPFDPEQDAPVRLIVRHRPGGDDVLTLQFTHILMDGHGAIQLLQQLLDPNPTPPAFDSVVAPTDVIDQILARTPLRRRLRAVRTIIRLARQAKPMRLPLLEGKLPAHPSPGHVTLRWLDESASSALRERLERIGPYANLSLAILSSGCRVLSRYIPGPPGPRSAYEMVLPYNLRRGAHKRLIFHNIATRLVLTARPDELEDRDELIRKFASQLRMQITDNITIGHLQLGNLLHTLDRWAPWLPGLLLLRPKTLHGSSWEPIEYGRQAFGATVDHVWAHTLFVPRFGVSLNLGKAGKRYRVVFMHSPHNLSDQNASRLLDEWLEDLCRA